MADIECDIQFTGCRHPVTGDGSFTLSHGVSPSIATIEVAQGAGGNFKGGDLRILQNGRDVTRPFRDCAIAGVVNNDGATFTLKIKDRRWRWQKGGGVVKAHYNRRDPKGKVIRSTFKSPKELCIELLEALKEQNFDVSGVPTDLPRDATPEALWDYANPAEALGQLVDALGCRVVLTTRDQIRICRLGFGNQLPRYAIMEGEAESIENTDTPRALLFVAGRTLWQGYWVLEAVGLDLDKKIKPINELSYKPADGWEKGSVERPSTGVTYGRDDKEKKQARDLADQTVWRWYRIKNQPDGTLLVPGFVGRTPSTIEPFLPLPGTPLFDTAESFEGSASELKPWVEGEWEERELRADNTPVEARDTEFSVDNENGVVQFGKPRYMMNGGDVAPARLWLYLTYHIATDGIPQRFTHERVIERGNSPPMAFKEEDIERRVTLIYKPSTKGPVFEKFTENKDDLARAARYYLDAKQTELAPSEGQDRPMGGFWDVSPDGRIQQVTWNLSDGVGTTRASSNTEHAINIPPYSLRRRHERTEAMTRSTRPGRAS